MVLQNHMTGSMTCTVLAVVSRLMHARSVLRRGLMVPRVRTLHSRKGTTFGRYNDTKQPQTKHEQDKTPDNTTLLHHDTTSQHHHNDTTMIPRHVSTSPKHSSSHTPHTPHTHTHTTHHTTHTTQTTQTTQPHITTERSIYLMY